MTKTLRSGDNLKKVTLDAAKKMFPGFAVICRKCRSQRVAVRNTTGYSVETGDWGKITLECADCGNKAEIGDTLTRVE